MSACVSECVSVCVRVCVCVCVFGSCFRTLAVSLFQIVLEFTSCVKFEVAVLGSLSLTLVRTVSVGAKQH